MIDRFINSETEEKLKIQAKELEQKDEEIRKEKTQNLNDNLKNL